MEKTQCGLFDFMAHDVGIKVLHPGGNDSTKKLLSKLEINKDSVVLDLACGVGTTSFKIHNIYKCKVKGIDISEDLISIARNELSKFKGKQSISFEVADARKLPFADNTFDAVVSQAFFILVNEQKVALEEIIRVLKPGGYFGSIELSWFKKVTEKAFNELKEKTCNDFIPRVKLFEEWDSFFSSNKLKSVDILKYKMDSGMLKMVKTEGIVNFVKIMSKMIKSPFVMRRMMDVQKTFNKYNDYLGYGIYCYTKI